MGTDIDRPTAWVSSTRTGHLDLECSGLDTVRMWGHDPKQKYQPHSADTLQELFDVPTDTPPRDGYVIACRICSLEPLLAEICTDARLDGPRDITIVTALGSRRPRRAYGAPSGDDALRRAKILEEAAARVRRLADAAGLDAVHTASGDVMFGHVSAARHFHLERHVRVVTVPTSTGTPTTDVVQMFWPLLGEGIEPAVAWQLAHDMQ